MIGVPTIPLDLQGYLCQVHQRYLRSVVVVVVVVVVDHQVGYYYQEGENE